MATNDTQFRIRLSPLLKERLDRAAWREGRSLNAEIARRLESSFTTEGKSLLDDLTEYRESLRARVEDSRDKIRRLDEALNSLDQIPYSKGELHPLIINQMGFLLQNISTLEDELREIETKIYLAKSDMLPERSNASRSQLPPDDTSS